VFLSFNAHYSQNRKQASPMSQSPNMAILNFKRRSSVNIAPQMISPRKVSTSSLQPQRNDRPCVVIDFGCAYIRIGFSGDDAATAVFRTVSKLESFFNELKATEDLQSIQEWLQKDMTLPGLMALGFSRLYRQALNALLAHAFSLLPNRPTDNFNVAVTHDSHAFYAGTFREIVGDLLFGDDFNAELIAFLDQAYVTGLDTIRQSGVLVISGASSTTILPVWDQGEDVVHHLQPLSSCYQQVNAAGDLITNRLGMYLDANEGGSALVGARRHFMLQEIKACYSLDSCFVSAFPHRFFFVILLF
jgi:hypothetical protein